MLTAEQVKSLVTFEMLLSSMCELSRVRKRMACVLHGGVNDTFSIKDDFFKCFACGRSGDIFTFVMEFFQVDFSTAKKMIIAHFNLEELPTEELEKLKQNKIIYHKKRSIDFDKWQKKASEFFSDCQKNLLQFAQPFLISRNITVATAMACLAWNEQEQYFNNADFGIEEDGRLKIPKGLLISSSRRKGITGLTVRQFNDKTNRYWQVKGSENIPFFIGNSTKTIFLMESGLDCILLFQESFRVGTNISCIALMGATGGLDDDMKDFVRQAEQVFYIPDNDKIGIEATAEIKKLLPNCRIILTGKSKDLGELSQKYGNSHIVADWLCNVLKIENKGFCCELCEHWQSRRRIEYMPALCAKSQQTTAGDWICPFFKEMTA